MIPAARSAADDRLHIAIIGSGEAGRACALQVLERGARVTLIEHRDLGGSRLNLGCVPPRCLSNNAHIANAHSNRAAEEAAVASIIQGNQWLAQQRERLALLRQAECEALENNPDCKLMLGEARFLDRQKLIVRLNDDSRKVSFRKIPFDRCLIATGAMPDIPQISGLGQTPYWTPAEALASPIIPPGLVVIGCSAIALELAQVFARLGSQVTLLNSPSRLFPDEPLMGETLTQVFHAEGITVLDGVSASEASFEDGMFTLITDQGEIHAERLLIAGERSANTHSLCADMIGVELDAGGRVRVDDQLQTNVADIYAAGSCATLPQLAEVAAEAGRLAAINMTGGAAALDPGAAPSIVFTDPQAGRVGLSEAQAGRHGLAAVSYVLPLERLPDTHGDTSGFIKIVAEVGTQRLLGVQLVATAASQLIQGATFALRAQMTVQDMAERQFPNLTRVEELQQCARSFQARF